MLWESVDPAAALTARFGFTGVSHAASWLAETIQSDWNSRLEQCGRLVISAGNLLAWVVLDGERVIVKCSVDQARFSRLTEADALVAWLDLQGMPVAGPITASDGRLRVERERFSLGLYPFVEGDLLDIEDPAQVVAAGRTLATLHEALAACPLPFGDGAALPNHHIVHGDFRSANIIQHGGRIRAIIDFEDVAHRSRTTDLARSAVLLGTRYHDWAPTSPETRDAFLGAYCNVAPLTGVQRHEVQRGVQKVLNHFGWI